MIILFRCKFTLLKNIYIFVDLVWLELIFVCTGIVGMSVSFTTVYLYSGELFPTVIRNIGVGTSSMCARIGSIAAPHIVSLVKLYCYYFIFTFELLQRLLIELFIPICFWTVQGDDYEAFLTPLIFGILPLIGAALCILLPETNGCELPETLQDGENFGK